MKKKILYLLIIYLLFGIVAGMGVLGYYAKKNKKEKKVLESLYYRQNTAFELCGNLNGVLKCGGDRYARRTSPIGSSRCWWRCRE